MSLDLLLKHFETIADAPGGVARLRELILQLAVQGRLVEQDPADEPASVLLQRIKEPGKTSEWQGHEDIVTPYLVPSKWVWTSFDDIVDFNVGKTPPTKEAKYWSKEGVPWVSISDMKHYETITHTDRKISIDAEKEIFRKNISPAGTLLMSFKLTIGKVSVLGIDAYHNEAIISIYPRLGILQEYLFRFLPVLALQGNTKNAIKGSTLNKESLSKMLIPLPPTLEQRRIVERVDQLMAICDSLEERQVRQGEQRKRLLASLIDALLGASRPDEVAAAWARLRDSFDLVFDAPESVAPLRQAVLQLAVQGRLVEQDLADEPASVLLERIREEKARLVKEGKLKKTEQLEPKRREAQFFTVPEGWQWTKLASLCRIITDGDHQPPPKAPIGVPFLVISNVSSRRLDFTEHRYVTQEYYDHLDEARKPYRGDILYTVTGSYGIPVLINEDKAFCVQRHIGIIKPSHLVNGRWLQYTLKSDFIYNQATASATGIAQKTVPLSGLRQFDIPLPPLAEQQRIVERVDQLVVLCDDLEAKLREERAAAERLAEALCKAMAGVSTSTKQNDVRRSSTTTPAERPRQMQMALVEPAVHPASQNDTAHHGNGVPTQAALDLGDVALNDDSAYSAVKALLAERTSLTNADLQAALGLDAATARGLLRRLVAEGIARQEGQRRRMRYMLSA